jgi:hypothetical protein
MPWEFRKSVPLYYKFSHDKNVRIPWHLGILRFNGRGVIILETVLV